MKGLARKMLCAWALLLVAHDAGAEINQIFSKDQQVQIYRLVEQFSSAMGQVTISPGISCPGLTKLLRSKLDDLQPLVQVAAQLSTAEFENSELARSLLDAEAALRYVENICLSV